MKAAKHFVISVMARDRVGIVAGVTDAIFKAQGNIDAMSQTVMRGYFTIIITASFEKAVDPERIRQAVAGSGEPGELAVSIQPWDRAAGSEPVVEDCDVFVLSIMGRDRTGIISRISSFLSSRNINIIDLYAFSEDGEFVFISQVMAPRSVDVSQLQLDLESLGKKSGLSVHFQHENIFLSTQRIDFCGGES